MIVKICRILCHFLINGTSLGLTVALLKKSCYYFPPLQMRKLSLKDFGKGPVLWSALWTQTCGCWNSYPCFSEPKESLFLDIPLLKMDTFTFMIKTLTFIWNGFRKQTLNERKGEGVGSSKIIFLVFALLELAWGISSKCNFYFLKTNGGMRDLAEPMKNLFVDLN